MTFQHHSVSELIDHHKSKKYWLLEVLNILSFLLVGISIYSFIYFCVKNPIKDEVSMGFTIFSILVGICWILGIGIGIQNSLDKYTKSETTDKLSKVGIGLSLCGLIGTTAYFINTYVKGLNNTEKLLDVINKTNTLHNRLWLIGGGVVISLFLLIAFCCRKRDLKVIPKPDIVEYQPVMGQFNRRY